MKKDSVVSILEDRLFGCHGGSLLNGAGSSVTPTMA